ncbi:hypothetical protein ACFODL_21120 [Phenylobacterium terrae]|uniref:Tip attachment protein J domain-containing protein n=2 Tax=Phenylobacterium terrae TaxID=2665495 RepID=A0ABW4MZW6_9CAUL
MAVSAGTAELLTSVGQVAGIGGVALGFALLIFRQVLRLNIFPQVTKVQAYRIIRLLLILTAIIALSGIAAWVAGEQLNAPRLNGEAETTGDCSFVIQAQSVDAAKVDIGSISCSTHPNATVRIAYYWLDAASYSSLVAGVPIQKVQRLLGKDPIVSRNVVHEYFADLVMRYGTTWEPPSGGWHQYLQLTSSRGEIYDLEDSRGVDESPPEDAPFTTYGPLLPFYVPDLNAARIVQKTDTWPAGYNLFYWADMSEWDLGAEGGLGEVDAQLAIDAAILWRYFTRADADGYGALVDELQAAVMDDPSLVELVDDHGLSDVGMFIESAFDDAGLIPGEEIPADKASLFAKEITADLRASARNNGVAAMRYVARDHWPEDWLVAYGLWEAHGELLSWTTVVPPRYPMILVAALDVVGGDGANLTLESISAVADERTALRPTRFGARGKAQTLPIPSLHLAAHDRVIVPLRIEFRAREHYDLDETWDTGARQVVTSDEDLWSAVEAALSALPSDTVLESGGFRKRVSSFPAPARPRITRAYTYGPSLEPTDAVVNGEKVALRPYNPASVFVRAGYDGGSCPTLYILRTTANAPTRMKNLIVKANGPSAAMTETVDLGRGVSSIIIREEEPEISTITSLQIVDVDSKRRLAKLKPFRLRYGQELEIRIPATAAALNLQLVVRGYYEPLTDIAMRAPSKPG